MLLEYAIISQLPFYLFFHNIVNYRFNILFDYVIALTILTLITDRTVTKLTKIISIAILSLVALLVCSWPLIPTIFVLLFYYTKDKRKYLTMYYVGFLILLKGYLLLRNYTVQSLQSGGGTHDVSVVKRQHDGVAGFGMEHPSQAALHAEICMSCAFDIKAFLLGGDIQMVIMGCFVSDVICHDLLLTWLNRGCGRVHPTSAVARRPCVP